MPSEMLLPCHRQGKKFGSCFNGLRVRMGVHTGPVSDIYRHPVTKRVIYDEALVTKAKLVSETACGGHVVITSDTMADVLDSGKVAEYAHILHVGGHILSAPAPPPEPPTDKAEDLPHDENETAMNLVNSDQRTTVAEFGELLSPLWLYLEPHDMELLRNMSAPMAWPVPF